MDALEEQLTELAYKLQEEGIGPKQIEVLLKHLVGRHAS
jgi:hypothetical protein